MSLRFTRVFAFGFALSFLGTGAHAQDKTPPRTAPLARVRATTADDAKRILSALAADSMEGRATGTPGIHRAAKYIAEQMAKVGLMPLGDSGFFQKVPVAMGVSTNGRGGRARVQQNFAGLDSIPADRRRTEVNVLGVIRGADPVLKNEIVLVDAHYDHLGVRSNPAGGDSIYNGADDDASGVTAVLEIARQIKEGPPPARTIIFATTFGEEIGLLGTRWFIDHPPIPLAQFVANLEIEMIDRPDSLSHGSGGAWLTGFERSTMGDLFQKNGLAVYPDMRPQQSFFTRSDNIGFAQRGIVAHTLSSFNLHTDYHKASDDIAGADFVHMAAVINTGAKAVSLLSNGEKPAWHPGMQPVAPPGRGGH